MRRVEKKPARWVVCPAPLSEEPDDEEPEAWAGLLEPARAEPNGDEANRDESWKGDMLERLARVERGELGCPPPLAPEAWPIEFADWASLSVPM